MIKTIILDEAKVNEFIKKLEPNPFVCASMLPLYPQTYKDVLKEFLETTKIEPQTTKPNQSLPYEFEH